MYFLLLSGFIEGHVDNLSAHVDLFNLANNAKLFEVYAHTFLRGSKLAFVVLADSNIQAV